MTDHEADPSDTVVQPTRGAFDRRVTLTSAGRQGLARLPVGAELGRYLILGLRGEGGMGVVYSAYDPNLDRRVALKLILQDGADEGSGARLLREAQALAKLAHPNVVTVHDAGVIGDCVFIEMEDAGVPAASASANDLVRAPTSLDQTVAQSTRDGFVAGTPAFMAPEQWQGKAIDARADQYTFAASIFESLYSKLPYENPGRLSMRTRETRGEMVPRPESSEVPGYVHRALVRGLGIHRGRLVDSPRAHAFCQRVGRDARQARRDLGTSV